MKEEILTVTFQNAYNYGAILQCFALQKEIIDLGFESRVLNYDNPILGDRYKAFFIDKSNYVKGIGSFILRFRKKYLRQLAFEKFIKENIYMTNKYNKESICSLNWHNEILITGSDQVWNPQITKGFDEVYTLDFLQNCKKISYAASVGNSDFIEKYKDEYLSIMNRIDKVSVREEDLREKIDEKLGKKVETVLDPTLLLKRDKWEKYLKLNNEKNKYIVAYVVAPDDEYIKVVNDLSEKTGLPVIHFGIKNPGYKNVLKTAYTEGPLEFINYIKNAEYIVATSFHAAVFSIIFNKKFFIVPHRKTGERVTNLLNKLDIGGRIIYNLDEFKIIDYTFDTDWNKVNKTLEEEREKSINWLKNAIEG